MYFNCEVNWGKFRNLEKIQNWKKIFEICKKHLEKKLEIWGKKWKFGKESEIWKKNWTFGNLEMWNKFGNSEIMGNLDIGH